MTVFYRILTTSSGTKATVLLQLEGNSCPCEADMWSEMSICVGVWVCLCVLAWYGVRNELCLTSLSQPQQLWRDHCCREAKKVISGLQWTGSNVWIKMSVSVCLTAHTKGFYVSSTFTCLIAAKESHVVLCSGGCCMFTLVDMLMYLCVSGGGEVACVCVCVCIIASQLWLCCVCSES